MDDLTGLTLGAARATGAYPQALRAILGEAEVAAARRMIASWPGHAPTPLIDMPRLAAALGIARLRIKHEGHRFAVGSFKALGPPYALARAIQRRGEPAHRFTAIAATSGNHGRALAWGAARVGAACRIFMPAHTSTGRGDAIAAFGAEIVRVPGNFDAAFDAARMEASRGSDRILIADIAFAGADAVARDTLAGYAVLADELADALPDAPPSHVFVAAGNGTLMAATAARAWMAWGGDRPRMVAAEPARSDCLRQSLEAGRPIALADAGNSVMDGLVVGTPSRIAWPILADAVDAAATVDDADAIAMLRRLADGIDGDPPVEIGETGIAAIATLARCCATSASRDALGIRRDADMIAIACEGVTDRAVFDRLRSHPRG
jgi:diaminopropionate ammonia-lyase family